MRFCDLCAGDPCKRPGEACIARSAESFRQMDRDIRALPTPELEALMGEIDISKIKPGDRVTVRGHVVGVTSTGKLRVSLDAASGTLHEDFGPEHIATHEPKPLAVGDKVWGTGTKENGGVRHVIGDLAWVEFVDGRHEICRLGEVERR